MSKAELQAKVDELYTEVLDAANRFAHHSKTFALSVLKLENPSYTEVAAQFRQLAKILDVLAEADLLHDSTVAQKTDEYVSLMEGIADAIDKEDADALEHYRNQLEKRPFL